MKRSFTSRLQGIDQVHTKGEFDGRITINGKTEMDAVSMLISNGSASFRLRGRQIGPHRDLHIVPFSKLMFLNLVPERFAEGCYYELRGTEIGSWTYGPLGHPGDGEYEIRRFGMVRLDVRYFVDRIEAVISGKTDPGTSPYDPNAVLDPWEFSVQFAIPRVGLEKLFGIDESIKEHVNALFEKHCERPGR